MIKIKETILIAFIVLAAATLAAQQKADDFNHFNPRFEVFALPGGTLGNSVQGIVQDSARFLWFASQEGLHRYDGQNFFTYRHDPFNPNSLASDYIEYIFLDSKGILWLAHYSDGGLTAFDPAKEIFTRYRHNPANSETLNSNTTSVVAEDRQGYIWVGGQSGLDRLDPKTGRFKRFHHDPVNPRSLSYDQVRALYVDKQGTLWVGTGFPFDTKNPVGGLNRYDPKTETFTRYLHDLNNSSSLLNNKIRALLEDSKGNFWVGTGGDGLHLMNRKTGTFTRLQYDPANPGKLSAPWVPWMIAATQMPEYHITSIMEDRDGRIWITGFPGGLNVYDPRQGTKRHFEEGQGEGHLTVNHLWQTFQTKDGVIWIATAGAGQKVFKVKKQDDRFPFLSRQAVAGSFDGLVSGVAKGFDGKIWIGFSSGTPLVQLDRKIGKGFPVSHRDTAAGGFNAREVTSVSFDRDGFLWIGTENGLFRRDPATGKFRHFLKPETGNTTSFGSVLHDRNGYIWAPSWHTGLYRIDLKTGGHVHFRHDPSNPASLGNGFVWGVYEDDRGNIWVSGGSYNDLAHPLLLDRFNSEQGTFDHFIKEKEAGCATGVAFDKRGNIWFVDNMNNLQQLNPADGKRRKITPADGSLSKPANKVISLAQGKDGRFWLYGDNKLFEFDPETEQFYIHGEAHGVSPVGDNRSPLHEAHDGEMLICGERGLLAFYPENIAPAKNSRPPDLRITAFRLHDERILPGEGSLLEKPVWETTGLRLAHDQNLFAFSVACFDFHDPAASQLQFMLEGYDRGWRKDLRDGATPAYVNVPPGKYTFRVRGADSHGVWNMNGASVHITILPPWWKTWWAYTLYALAGIGFLFWLWHLDRKKQQQKLLLEQEKLAQERQVNEQLRRVDALKDQFLANTSHELRTPLQGIIGLSQHLYDAAGDLTISELRENLAMTISSGKRLNSLVNDILDFSKLKNAGIELHPHPVNLHAMADVVLKNMAALAAAKNLTLINDVPTDLTADADENRLQQILFNLVGNAVKFTEAGHVRVGGFMKVDKVDKVNGRNPNLPLSSAPIFVSIFVEDTGPGIPADKQEAVFQEFVQVEDSATRQFAGTGLGLSVTKRLVELHGGRLWLKSEVGSGSTFYFTLPMASGPVENDLEKPVLLKNAEDQMFLSSPDDGPAPTKFHPSSLLTHRSISILVVDDEPVNQQVLKNHLHTAHYHITPALNGEEALLALESGRTFDLVLLDLMMPHMSGYEVCQKIREKYLPSELPVIMVTAKNQVQDLVQGLNTGANDYLSKPFSKEEFLARVKTQLNLHHINEATSKFVPNEFLRSLGRENIAEVLLGDHVEREVTVLFADIRDYTTLSESMMPEENFNFVKAFNGRMGPVIQQHKGFVNQYLGDGIMAIFPENPADALLASVAMQIELAAYNEYRATKGRKPIRVGLGMHTGSLIMGIIGDQHRLDAATISDAVNTASRLESLTKYYGANIIISKDSLDKIGETGDLATFSRQGSGSNLNLNTFHVRYLGKVQVKGKHIPVHVYECFNGDKPAVIEKKLATLEVFTAGMQHYLDKQFAAAAAAFEAVLQQHPDDVTAQLFLNKATHFVAHGAPETWTGVEMMEGK